MIPTKAERTAGEDRRVALATFGSTKFRMMHANALYYYTLWRSEIAKERSDGHSDYVATMIVMMMMMMKDDLCQEWRVKLISQGNYRLSGTRIVECLKIIDVGCNLKQFDVVADRKFIFRFRPLTKLTKMKLPFRPKYEN